MTRVLLFGRLADLAGWRDRTLSAEPGTLGELRQILAAADATLGEALGAAGVRAAVDKVLVADDLALALAPGAEVAFMPPMSGG
jgi:molybdopterin synthase sulfur carrier subunit